MSTEQTSAKCTKLTPAQRQRKRETDRAAQRIIRERRNKYISQLEGLVKTLQKGGNNDERVEDLVCQIKAKDDEILRLRQGFASVNKIANALADPLKPGSSRPYLDKMESQSTYCDIQSPAMAQQLLQDRGHQLRSLQNEQFCNTGLSENATSEYVPISPGRSHLAGKEPDLLYTVQLDSPKVYMQSPRLIAPKLDTSSVSKSNSFSSQDGVKDVFENSLSKIANSILQKRNLDSRLWSLAGCLLHEILKYPQNVKQDLEYSEDIPIRGVVEGWEAVLERHGSLDLGWQWLQYIDRILFPSQPIPERLAILRMMRLQLEYQIHPQMGASQTRPSFFSAKPIQDFLPHDPLLEHYVWPGLRERMLLTPKRYASNSFMDNFTKSLGFLWPFQPTDCYLQNLATGCYQYSDSFKTRQADLRCWSVRMPLFEKFPELQQDMPAFDQSPYDVNIVLRPGSMDSIAPVEDQESDGLELEHRGWIARRRN